LALAVPRRTLVASLAAATAIWPRSALSAPLDSKHRLGVFAAGWGEFAVGEKERESEKSERQALLKSLAEQGYVQGGNLQIDWRNFDKDFSQVPQAARDLVRLVPDVLVTWGTLQTRALQDATRSIPIVASLSDPVASGFTKALARPQGNVTGLCHIRPELPVKQIELLRRVVPRLNRIMLIGDARFPGMRQLMEPEENAAKSAGLTVEVRMIDRAGFERVFREMKRLGAGAALISFSNVDFSEVARLAIRHGVATLADGEPRYVEEGGLVGYDTFHENPERRIAMIIDRLFRGAKPADIPWELPDRTLLEVNLRTAKALGLTIPPDVLLRADKVFE
jgi:putative ABC transport system substrate-binding protein